MIRYLRFSIIGILLSLGGFLQLHGQDSLAIQSLLDRAKVHADAAAHDSAIHTYWIVKEQADAQRFHVLALQAATGHAKAYRHKGAYQKADSLIAAALAQFIPILGHTHVAVGKAYYQQGIIHHFLQNFPKARTLYTKALNVALLHSDSQELEIANTYTSIGLTYSYEEKIDSATVNLTQSLDHYTKADLLDHPYIVATYNALGIVSEKKTDYKGALEYYEKALEVSRINPDKSKYQIPSIYNNLGVISQRLEDYGQAILFFNYALALYRPLYGDNHPLIALTQNNLSVSYQNKEDFRTAQDMIDQAIETYLKIGGAGFIRLGSCYNNLGQLHMKEGNLPKAYEAFSKALTVYRNAEGSIHPEMGLILANLGKYYGKVGQHKQALAHFDESLVIRKTHLGPYHPRVADTYLEWGEYYRNNGQFEAAIERFERSQAVCLRGDSLTFDHMKTVYAKPTLLRALKRTAACQLALGKESDPAFLTQSAKSFETAIHLLDLLRLDYQQGISKQTLLSDARAIYEGALEVTWALFQQSPSDQFLQDAFELIERSHAVLLQESLHESEARQFAGIPDSLISQERDLKVALSYAEKRLFDLQQSEEPQQAELDQWNSEIVQLHKKHDALIAKFEQHYPNYFHLKYQLHPPDISEVQAQLSGDQEQLITYFMGDSSLFAMGVEKGKVLFNRIEIDDQLVSSLGRFIHQLRDPFVADNQGNDPALFNQYLTDAHFLYSRLLGPMVEENQPDSGPTTLILVPDGRLGYLPFEALLKETVAPGTKVNYGPLPYVLKAHRIRYTYSARLLANNPKKGYMGKGYLGFAPSYDAAFLASARDVLGETFVGLGNLQGNQPEVSHIRDLVGGQQFLGNMATEAAFKENGPQHGILHLAMHAFLHPESPDYSGLIFSNQPEADSIAEEDGILHVYELYNLELEAELAVLSACNTGGGQLAQGEGIMSMARAFRYAGCPNIVMSLWQADDHSTASLMQQFYTRLKEGLPKDEALRQARLDFLEQNAQKHPYYWAAFVLTGDDKPLFSPSEPSLFFWTVIALLAISLGGVGWRVLKK